MDEAGERLSRREISEAVGDLGWRFILGAVRAHVRVESLAQAAAVATRAVAAAGPDADRSLRVDLRADRVTLTVQSLGVAYVTPPDIAVVRRVDAAVRGLGLLADAGGAGPATRPAQAVEIAIDALDIPAVRPFWRAVMGYVDEPGAGPEDAIVDPAGQAPAIWFQQMDQPRPQRNRIHLDVSVSHDEAPRRIEAAVGAGGVLVSAAGAPAFWVLADAEGNEACVTTWQGRDP